MNKTFELIKALIAENDVLVSVHGYEELAEDNLYASDIVNNAVAGLVIEDYPEYHKGPAVIVTAYRPDPKLWSKDLKRRLKK